MKIQFGRPQKETDEKWREADSVAVLIGSMCPCLYFFSNEKRDEPTALQQLIAFISMFFASDNEAVEHSGINEAGIHVWGVEDGIRQSCTDIIPYNAFGGNKHCTMEQFRQKVEEIRNTVFKESYWTFEETVRFLEREGILE